MENELIRLACNIGHMIREAIGHCHRDKEDNHTWGKTLKTVCQRVLDWNFNHTPYYIQQLSTPYNTDKIGKGKGRNVLEVSAKRLIPPHRQIVYCLEDIVDGTWNAAAGYSFSTSTMLAFTQPRSPLAAEQLTLGDFWLGLIVPFAGEGFYYNVRGECPRFRQWNGKEEPLHLTDNITVEELRCMIDLFTTQTYAQLRRALRAVLPVMYAWADFARWYGAGGELMALLGRPGVTPAFGGYIAANQKMDNIVSTSLILSGAGAYISDWFGNSLQGRTLTDRTDVIFAANEPLYQCLRRQLAAGLSFPELLLPEKE